MIVRRQLEYASEVWIPYSMRCITKIEQIQGISCRLIFFQKYNRDTYTSLLINLLYLDSLYTRRLIQQATTFYKIHYNLVDMSSILYINIAYKYYFFPRNMNISNRLPCYAVLHVTPSVDSLHMFALPEITIMQPLYGAALINFM